MIKILDDTAIRLHNLVSHDAAASASRAAFNDLDYVIRQKVRRPPPSANNTWDPVVITPFLNACRQLVEEELRIAVAGYSSFRWLWYLRRLPMFIFEGSLNTIYSYDAALAEVISGLSEAVDISPILRNGYIAYDINDSVVRRILKFCNGVIFLSHIHTLIRLAGKGTEFSFGRESLPHIRQTLVQDEAIRLYDNRIDKCGRPLIRVGTVVASDNVDTDLSTSILVVHFTGPQYLGPSVLGSVMGEYTKVEVYVNYQPKFISLKELGKLNADSRLAGMWWKPEAGILLLLLRLAISLMVNLQFATITLRQHGYFMVEEELFNEIVDVRIAWASETVQTILPGIGLPANASELISALEHLSGLQWPLRPGPPIRRSENLLCVDIYTATAQLDCLFTFPRVDGDLANVRADHFERTVQDVINSSIWCPSNNLMNLRGLTLRHGGKPITDLDAVGAHGDILLIVSCKSLIYSGAYDIGDYNIVRNVASTIEQATTDWNKVKAFLEVNPIGNNYDFSGYKRLIAVVCTPHPVYVHLGPTTQMVAPGLMAASSLSELSTWLHEPNTGSGSG